MFSKRYGNKIVLIFQICYLLFTSSITQFIVSMNIWRDFGLINTFNGKGGRFRKLFWGILNPGISFNRFSNSLRFSSLSKVGWFTRYWNWTSPVPEVQIKVGYHWLFTCVSFNSTGDTAGDCFMVLSHSILLGRNLSTVFRWEDVRRSHCNGASNENQLNLAVHGVTLLNS